jgi:hypothetical protein
VSHILSYLPLLACPAGMALMMLMMRSKPSGPPRSADDTRIARLEREIEILRAEGRGKDEAAGLDRAS